MQAKTSETCCRDDEQSACASAAVARRGQHRRAQLHPAGGRTSEAVGPEWPRARERSHRARRVSLTPSAVRCCSWMEFNCTQGSHT